MTDGRNPRTDIPFGDFPVLKQVRNEEFTNRSLISEGETGIIGDNQYL